MGEAEQKVVRTMALSMIHNSQATVDEILSDLGIPIDMRTKSFVTKVLGQSLLVFDRVIELAKEKEGVVDEHRTQQTET